MKFREVLINEIFYSKRNGVIDLEHTFKKVTANYAVILLNDKVTSESIKFNSEDLVQLKGE